MTKKGICLLVVSLVFLAAGTGYCGSREIARFPLDSLDGVITRDGVSLDTTIKVEGGGSLRVETNGPTVIRLFEVRGLNVDKARLAYRASVRTEKVKGKVYLEMWLRFQGQGEYFSRGLQNPLTGTNEWSTLETPFFLKKGDRPDMARLNLVVEGPGVIWIDDIRLICEPLK